jgi:phage FluMu protein gp41
MLPERRQLARIVRSLSKEKLARLLKYAEELEEELTPEDIEAIERGKAQIARGEWVSFEEVKRQNGL